MYYPTLCLLAQNRFDSLVK